MAYLVSFPFYFFESGSPQVSTFIIAAQLLYFFVYEEKLKSGSYFQKVNRVAFFLAMWVIALNVFYHYYLTFFDGYEKFEFLMSASYFLLNWWILLLPMILYQKYGQYFLQVTFIGLFLGIVFPIVFHLLGFSPPVKDRVVLFFKNPNQLGYYCLLALTMILIIRDQVSGVKPYYFLIASLGCLYMAFVSISFAAIGSVVLLFMVDFLSRSKNRVRNIASMGILGLAIFSIISSTQSGQDAIRVFTVRQESKEATERGGEKTEYQKRNYDRIENHPEYLALGAGEGAYERFVSFDSGNEIHSTFGTIAFCYGMPGLILFIFLIYMAMKYLKPLHRFYAMPILIYGITHNGVRFSMFWVTLAIFATIGFHRIVRKTR